jgi:hypothetical protein
MNQRMSRPGRSRRSDLRVHTRGPLLAGIAATLTVAGLSLTPVAAASAVSCPNEELRVELASGSLPDCRAYELVTPPYKEGGVVIPVAVAEDGEHVAFSSFLAFGDVEGDRISSNPEGANVSLRAPKWAGRPARSSLRPRHSSQHTSTSISAATSRRACGRSAPINSRRA